MKDDFHFDAEELASQLDAADMSRLDEIAFGIVKLDSELRVRYFSSTEARLSGWGEKPIHNLKFFLDVAPCMNRPELAGRVARAAGEGRLDVEVGHTGDLADPTRFMRCRIMSASDGGFWLALQRDLS